MAVTINGTTGVSAVQDGAVQTADIADGAITGGKMGFATGRRNMVINGAMQVWQRGTSQNGSNSYGSVDRFVPYASTITFQRSTDAPDGFDYSIETTGTPSAEYLLSYGIELPVTGSAGVFYVGQTITVSYYAKSTNAGDVLMDWMAFRDSSTSSSNQVEAKTNDGSDTHTLTTSWARYSKTYTITGTPAGTNDVLTLAIRNYWTNSIASGNISITGVQVEIGDTATPFEHRLYGEELSLCQRYYQTVSIGRYKPIMFRGSNGNIADSADFPLRVTMRTTPTGGGGLTGVNTAFWGGLSTASYATETNDWTVTGINEENFKIRITNAASISNNEFTVRAPYGLGFTGTFDAEI